jgi:hypothetical protein
LQLIEEASALIAESVTKIRNSATIDRPTIAKMEEAIQKSLVGTLAAVKKEQEKQKLAEEVCC